MVTQSLGCTQSLRRRWPGSRAVPSSPSPWHGACERGVMQLWTWLGVAAGLLIALPASAQPTGAFPTESLPAGAARASDPHAGAPEPVVHGVASQQQPEQLSHPVSEPVTVPPPPSELAEAERWYGGYTLLTDGFSLASAIAGALAEPDGGPFFLIAGSGYLFGGPIVHLVHGNPGRAAASLGLRVALPIAFVGVSAALDDCHGRESCGLGSLVIGVPLGMAAAIALDAAALARDHEKRPLALVPTASLGRNSALVGVGGSF